MNFLLKTIIQELAPATGEEGQRVKLCAYANDAEQLSLVTYVNGSLMLYVINSKHPQNSTKKRIDWSSTGYGRLSALCFNSVGSHMIAVSTKHLHLMPFLAYTRPGSSGSNPVEDIRLIPQAHAEVTCCVWWQTSLNTDIAVIGTETGEIIFFNLKDKRCVHRTQVNGHVLKLEVVADDRQHTTFLLISGRSSLQWRLPLDVLDHDLHLTLSQDKMEALGYHFYGGKRYIKSILQARGGSTDNEFQPCRFTNISISVSLRYQNAKGCHLLSAMDRADNSLKIYDSSMEHNPLFIYSLPQWSDHVVYTDRLIFFGQSGAYVQVISNQLAECHSSPKQDEHIIYKLDLEQGETILYMTCIKFARAWYVDLCNKSSGSRCKAATHTILDGCLLITTNRLLQIVPNISPEQLFLDWGTEDVLEPEKLDCLARVTNIDVLKLYLHTAEFHLLNGNTQLAVQCLALSKCGDLTKISLLYKHKHYLLVTEAAKDVLHPGCTISSDARVEISNMVLDSFLNIALAQGDSSPLELSSPPEELSSTAGRKLSTPASETVTTESLSSNTPFREFLIYNNDYSLDLAMKLLCQHNATSLLIHLALARKFIFAALEHLFNEGRITPHVLHQHIACKEFINALNSVLEGALVHLLAPNDLCTYLLSKEELKTWELSLLELRLSKLGPESLRLLAVRYHAHSEYVQTSVVKYRDYIDSSGRWYAVEQMGNSHKQSVGRYTSTIYRFYIKVLLNMPLSHDCLLVTHLRRMSSMSHDLDIQERKCELQTARYGRPVCCSSRNVYSIQTNSLFTWGSAVKLDELSVEERVKSSTPTLFELSDLNVCDVKVISCGEKHLMLLTASGELYGWGSSTYGQVGGDDCGEYKQVTKVSMEDCIDVVCGRYHTLALDKHGRVYSWGWGLFGQLGHGNIENEHSPRLVEHLADMFVGAVAAGHCHSLALSIQGDVWAFGDNTYGQITSHLSSNKICRPHKLDLRGHVELISTRYFYNIAVMSSGEISVWGVHPFSLRKKVQSLISTSGTTSRPHRLSTGEEVSVVDKMKSLTSIDRDLCTDKIVQVVCGATHSVFLTDVGSVYTCTETFTLRLLSDLSHVVYIAADNGFSLALTADGIVHSWGRNNHGQLGLALRNIRHAENPGKVKIAASYRRTSTVDMYGVTMVDHGKYDSQSYSTVDACDPLALYKLSRLEYFPTNESLSLFMDRKQYPAVVSLLSATNNWSEAFFYHLKSLQPCQGHLDNYCQQVLDVMSFYIERIVSGSAKDEIHNSLTQVMYRMLQFWQAKRLPARPELETTLTLHLDHVSLPLYSLLLPNTHDQLLAGFVSAFSSSFLAKLTREKMRKVGRLRDSRTSAWESIVKTVKKGVASRAPTLVNSSDLERLATGHSTQGIVFSCGHHFEYKYFVENELASFESRVMNKLPVSGAAILYRYQNGLIQSLACPQCVSSSMKALVN